MSKIISDEEMMEVNEKLGLSFSALITTQDRAIAKAQRDSSDREWIEKIEPHMEDMTGILGNPEGNKFIVISEKNWQALKQKEA